MPNRRPTLADVAATAGVSKAAVSRVINDAPGVSAQTREHIQAVIARLGYRPDPVARALAHGGGEVVELVVVDDPSCFGISPYYGRVTAGILRELTGSTAQLRVHVVEEPAVEALLTSLTATAGPGVLMVNVPPAYAAGLYERCDRVVSMSNSAPGIPFVGLENTEGAYAAVEHLRAAGRSRIAAIHGPDGNPCADGRRAGYRRAVRDLGLPEIESGGAAFRREAGYEQAARLLAADPDLDALFVACDIMATGAMQALADAGRRIPGDVAVVGFDDSLLAACSTPPMSSVQQPVEEMAAAATRALLHRRLAPHWRCVFPAPLKVRQSSSAA